MIVNVATLEVSSERTKVYVLATAGKQAKAAAALWLSPSPFLLSLSSFCGVILKSARSAGALFRNLAQSIRDASLTREQLEQSLYLWLSLFFS